MEKQAPSLAGRAALALVLMVGFYVLALGICVGLGAIVWADVQSRHVHAKLVLFCAITIAVVLWSVVPRPLRFPDPGVELRAAEQPALHSVIREIAAAAGQAMPKRVFLVGDVNAFVAQRGGVLGFGGERVLGLGLPLLQVLTVPQLRAVVAHEFGHFHGGDTKLGPLVYRTRDAIGRTIVNLKKADSLMNKPFEWYGSLFLRVTHAVSRAQEFAADALSVRLTGVEPVQTALRRVNEVGPLFDHYFETEFLPVLNRGARPPLAHGFGLYLRSPAMQKVQVEVGEQAMQAKGNPFDTHPPLSQRLAAAAQVSGPGRESAAGPLAATLLRGIDALEADLLAFQFGNPKVKQEPTGPWEEVCGPALARGWERFAAEHAAKLPDLRVAQLAAQRGALGDFAKAVAPQAPPEERDEAGALILATLLAHALVRGGFRVVTGPGEPILLEREGAKLDPYAIGRSLAKGELGEAIWAETCERHGLGGLALSGKAAG